MTTKRASDIRRNHDNAGGLHELLAPAVFVDEQTVLTKRLDLFSVFRVPGIDAECMTPELLESVTRRFEASLRILGTDYRVLQYVIKRDSPPMPAAHPGPAERRAAWMESREGSLYSLELFMVILRIHPLERSRAQRFYRQAAELVSGFVMRRVVRMGFDKLRRETEALATAINSLAIQLEDTLKPVVLERAEIVHFLRRLVNYEPWKTQVLGTVHANHLDQQMTQSGLECWPRFLKMDGYFIHVLSLIEPPGKTFTNLLRGLSSVPCQFVMCSEWKREPNGTVRGQINTMRRHYHLGKTSMMSYIGGGKEAQPHEVLLDDSKSAVITELNNALTEMEVHENHFGRYSLTIALFSKDEHQLSRAVARTAEVFSTHDAKVVEETYNLRNAWLAMVPGNYARNQRQLWLLNTNYADMAFLFAPECGQLRNEHLNRGCLATVETRESTLFHLNLHYQDTGHTSILGSIGSGKSFLTNFLIGSYQQYQPVTTIFDIGGSYQRLTAEFGGSYAHIGRGGFTINPFSLPPTPENFDFLFSFVRVLIETGNGAALLNDEDRKDLYRNIEDLYEQDPEERTLSILASTCSPRYRRALDEWIGKGRLAQYFDNVEDTLSIARFQAFDFEGMDKPEVVEPMLFYVLHRTNAVIYDRGQHSTAKLVVIDEAWKFFRNATTKAYINEALKTWRKRNAVCILATQSSQDLEHVDMLSTVVESCFTKIFLANPGMDANLYREKFHLNSTEAGIVSRLIPKREFLLKRPDMAKVLSLNVDPEALRIFSNHNAPQGETHDKENAAHLRAQRDLTIR